MSDRDEQSNVSASNGVGLLRGGISIMLAVAAVVGIVTAMAAVGDPGGHLDEANDRRQNPSRRDTTTWPAAPASVSTIVELENIEPSTPVHDAPANAANPAWAPSWTGPQLAGPKSLPPVDRPSVNQYVLALDMSDDGPQDQPYGAGCSPGPGPLADGIWVAGLVGADTSSIQVDLVCLFPQQADMWSAPNGETCDGPFDSAEPCMTNESDAIRRLVLSPSVEIALPRVIRPQVPPQQIDEDWPIDLAPSTPEELLTYLAAGTVDPFWIRIEDGAVTRIEEHRNLFSAMVALD